MGMRSSLIKELFENPTQLIRFIFFSPCPHLRGLKPLIVPGGSIDNPTPPSLTPRIGKKTIWHEYKLEKHQHFISQISFCSLFDYFGKTTSNFMGWFLKGGSNL